MDRDRGTTRVLEKKRATGRVLMRTGSCRQGDGSTAAHPVPSSPILPLAHRLERTYHGRDRRHGSTLLQLRRRAVAGARAVGQRGDQADRPAGDQVLWVAWYPGVYMQQKPKALYD